MKTFLSSSVSTISLAVGLCTLLGTVPSHAQIATEPQLHDAVTAATGGDTIQLSSGVTITLTNEISSGINFTIDGQGGTLNGGNTTRIFSLSGDLDAIKNITFRESVHNTGDGGALEIASNLTGGITSSSFIDNSNQSGGSTKGGAVFVSNMGGGILDSRFENNSTDSHGGAIFVGGTLTGDITGSTFINNSASDPFVSGGGALSIDA